MVNIRPGALIIATALQKPILNMDQAWESFKMIESQTWITSGMIPPSKPKEISLFISALVKPSGALTSPVSHRLHQPSYSTSNAQNEETADPTSTCIAMVTGTVFEKGKTLIYDQLHRRDQNSEGMQYYPQTVLDCHDEFTHQVTESSEAKVEVVYGAPVEDYLRKQFKEQAQPFPSGALIMASQSLLSMKKPFVISSKNSSSERSYSLPDTQTKSSIHQRVVKKR